MDVRPLLPETSMGPNILDVVCFDWNLDLDWSGPEPYMALNATQHDQTRLSKFFVRLDVRIDALEMRL